MSTRKHEGDESLYPPGEPLQMPPPRAHTTIFIERAERVTLLNHVSPMLRAALIVIGVTGIAGAAALMLIAAAAGQTLYALLAALGMVGSAATAMTGLLLR